MSALAAYVGAVGQAVRSENGVAFADLLRWDSESAKQSVAEAVRSNPRLGEQLGSYCGDRLPAPFDELMAHHCACLAAMSQGRYADAYSSLTSEVTPTLRAFRDAEGPWLLAPLHGLATSLRRVAEAADRELQAAGKVKGGQMEKMADSGQQLMKLFSETNKAQGNKAKRLAALEVVNQLFKIYFRLNTLRLCKNIIRAVEAPSFTPLESFPMSQRVTYMFYTGRLSVFDDDYHSADTKLTFAFEHCHRNARGNKKRILQYLVPVKLLQGQVPKPGLLDRYGLGELAGIAAAMRSGDIRSFDAALEKHQEYLIRAGTYLILEKLRMSVYRTLLKRIQVIHKEVEPAKASQVPLALLQRALEWLGSEMDLDEVECVVANMVYRKYVKGYLSHKQRVLVVSKAAPFPPLTTVVLHDG